jgi:hypothetical protein
MLFPDRIIDICHIHPGFREGKSIGFPWLVTKRHPSFDGSGHKYRDFLKLPDSFLRNMQFLVDYILLEHIQQQEHQNQALD